MELLAAASLSYWPFVILVVSVGFVMVGISKLRLPAFVALIGAALIAGLMAEKLPESRETSPLADKFPDPGKSAPKFHFARAVEMTATEFGKTAGGIAISICFAGLIGMCLMESGAADKVVRRFLAAFGEKNAGVALLLSTYVLSVPIFFDTMFMLMVPLAKALQMASRNPARFLGRADLGVIKPGALASLVHLDNQLNVLETWVEGT